MICELNIHKVNFTIIINVKLSQKKDQDFTMHNQHEDENRPINPRELLENLLRMNMKQVECENQSQKHSQQRKVLQNLLQEYSIEIQKLNRQEAERHSLQEVRAKLELDVDHVRRERKEIEMFVRRDVEELKIRPIQIQEQTDWEVQISLLKEGNHKAALKRAELEEYAIKLEALNHRLQEERRIGQMHHHETSNSGMAADEELRTRIQSFRREQSNYSQEMRLRLREREQLALRNTQEQEWAISERNRHRKEEFQLNRRNSEMINKATQISAMENASRMAYTPAPHFPMLHKENVYPNPHYSGYVNQPYRII